MCVCVRVCADCGVLLSELVHSHQVLTVSNKWRKQQVDRVGLLLLSLLPLPPSFPFLSLSLPLPYSVVSPIPLPLGLSPPYTHAH